MLRCRQRRPAYSLVEVLVASSLSGVLLVAALSTMGGAAQTWLAVSDTSDAQSLAHGMLAEVLARHYADPDTADDPNLRAFGPESDETGATRGGFDDIDDYDDWTASPPQTRDGQPIDAYKGWSRSVVVRKLKKRKVNDFRDDDDDDHESRQITVTVTDPEGATYTLEALRARIGGMGQSLGLTDEFVTGVSVTVTRSEGDPQYESATLVNHAEGP